LTKIDGDSFILDPKAVEYHHASKDILFYPEIPGDVNLRDHWYMVRRRRPMVPAPSGMPMPDKYKDPEKRAQLYSVYLRPWVLDRSSATPGVVPHIAMLNAPLVSTTHTARVRLRFKQANPSHDVRRSYAVAWRNYIRGKVVSRYAQQIIIQFMAACCGKSKKEEDVEETAIRMQLHIPVNELELARVHALLDAPGEKPAITSVSSRPKKKKDVAEDDADDEHIDMSAEVLAGMHAVDKLWQRDTTLYSFEDIPLENKSNTRLTTAVPDVKRTKKAKYQRKTPEENRRAQSRAYVKLALQDIKQWWAKVEASKQPPSLEQRVFLNQVIARCLKEQSELSHWETAGCYRKAEMFQEHSWESCVSYFYFCFTRGYRSVLEHSRLEEIYEHSLAFCLVVCFS
jgi:hypothetical protein